MRTPSAIETAAWALTGVLAAVAMIYIMQKSSSNASISRQSSVEAKESKSDRAAQASPTVFKDKYALGKRLGSGSFAIVRQGVELTTGKTFAVKCIDTSSLSSADAAALKQEISILKQLHHPNIMALHEVYTEANYTYLVTELLDGGELFDRIVEKTFYSEKEARDVVRVVLDAIKYCHGRGVVHRDLKPENLLLTSKSDDASIKVADFGFAKHDDLSTGLGTACGSPGYVAPEILQRQKYGKAVDIWSLGVITFILLCGYPPFHNDNQAKLFAAIKLGTFKFKSPYWDDISDDAKDFISKMLCLEPAQRWTAEQLLKHCWLTGVNISTAPLATAMDELKKYNARRKFKAAVRTTNKNTLGPRSRPSTHELTLVTSWEPILHDIQSHYAFGQTLGEGSFSIVKAAVQATTGKTFAIKCIRRHDLDAKHMEFLGQEIDFLKMLNHPHIISLEAVYVDREGVYLVTEYMAGGELFDRIVEEAYYCEDEARKIVRVLLEALKYCHDQHVVHRDLKPENLFLASPTDNTTLKMGDFGFAAYAPEPTLRGTCGTPSYVAPEIIAGQPYGKPIDVWSLGVITFILLCGSPPFHGSTHIELYSSIRRGVYECPKDLSTDAQDVLAKMLVVEPTGRSTVEQLLDHPWIASDASKTPLTRTIEELHKFNMQRKFRSSVRVIQAVHTLARSTTPTALMTRPKASKDAATKRKSWFQPWRIFSGR
ncbi:unnamed protein product [Aphanomyces euteiches]|nr:hypothetical protein Ae201684P_015618 [Aphanomyces euteiches]